MKHQNSYIITSNVLEWTWPIPKKQGQEQLE